MQSKWILQTLIRIFASQQYDQCLSNLKAFLPQTMRYFKDVVLSPKLASTVEMCHFLAHYSSTENLADLCTTTCPDLETVLACVSSSLTCKTLQQYHRPITRISSLTMFKRFLNESHKVVVSKKLDAEAASKAIEVEQLIAQLQAKDLSLPGDLQSFEMQKLLEMVKDRVAWARDQVSSF